MKKKSVMKKTSPDMRGESKKVIRDFKFIGNHLDELLSELRSIQGRSKDVLLEVNSIIRNKGPMDKLHYENIINSMAGRLNELEAELKEINKLNKQKLRRNAYEKENGGEKNGARNAR